MSAVIQQVVNNSLFPYAELDEEQITFLATKHSHLSENQLLEIQDVKPLCDIYD